MDILPKLQQIHTHYEELSAALSRPGATDDMEKFTRLNKEYAGLTPVVENYLAYQKMLSETEDLKDILADKTADAEMKELAELELEALQEKLPEMEHQLTIQLLPKDANDDRNVILEVRAGTGGDEAGLFAADMFRMYCRFAEIKGWQVTLLEKSDTGVGGLKEVIAQVNGEGVYAQMKYESGVHRVQRVPATESQGRIHTSAITVAVLPEAEEVDIHIEAKDLRIDVFRSSGPGGQSVNTTDSAVRITHIPTGVVATCQDEKSQHKNREKAMKVLMARLFDAEQEKLNKERAENRKTQVGTGDRSERIRTYNYPQSRVTDHRINLTVHSLLNIMEGIGLDEIIENLRAEEQSKKLAALAE